MAKIKESVVKTKSLATIQRNTLPDLVEDINSAYGRFGAYMKLSVMTAVELGEYLFQAKVLIDYGGWDVWVDSTLPFSARQASKYMALYAKREKLTDEMKDLGINTTLRVLYEEATDAGSVKKKKDLNAKRLKEAEKMIEDMYEDREKLLKKIEDLEVSDDKDLTPEIVKLTKQLEGIKARIKGMELAHKAIVRGRDFFTRELSAIPALAITAKDARPIRADAEALVELVDNWLIAFREKFNV